MGLVMLLDAASLYYRAFYGRKGGPSTADGVPLNAAAGTLHATARLIAEHRPELVVACWDVAWRPSWRVDLIPDYKAARVADTATGAEDTPAELAVQVPIITDLFTHIGIPIAGAPDFEADDVAGTCAAQWVARGRGPAVIVTGDRDLFQMVDDTAGVSVLYPVKGAGWVTVDGAYLDQHYGVTGGGPAYAEYAVLRGDASDGLPGVRGVGEKTAAALLAKHWSLAGVRRAAAADDPAITPAVRKAIRTASNYLDAAVTVVAVRKDVPVDVDDLLATARAYRAQPGTLPNTLTDENVQKIVDNFRRTVQ